MSNENLRTAKKVKNDNFFTKYEDVENELSHYKDQLRDKIIYCNCDTPESNFVKFLNDVKDEWSIKDVWHTSIDEGISFDSEYAKEMLSKCDIVISNPPFSKARESYVPLLIESGKQFLFIGNLNMATMKEIFPLIRDGKMWTGYTHPKEFLQPDGTYKKFGNTLWWTNMFVDKPFALDCTKHFDESKYPMYDNYAAWNVDKVKDIPCDESIIVSVDEEKYHALVDVYKEDCLLFGKSDGKYIVEIIRPIWGVPVTFIEHYTPPCILRTGGYFGSDTLDSAPEQTGKTLEQTGDTTICVTLSGNRCDLENRGGSIPQIPHSDLSGMSMTSAMVRALDSLKSTETEYISESSSTVFSLIGISEENGMNLSGGVLTDSLKRHAYIKGVRRYTRLFIQ